MKTFCRLEIVLKHFITIKSQENSLIMHCQEEESNCLLELASTACRTEARLIRHEDGLVH